MSPVWFLSTHLPNHSSHSFFIPFGQETSSVGPNPAQSILEFQSNQQTFQQTFQAPRLSSVLKKASGYGIGSTLANTT